MNSYKLPRIAELAHQLKLSPARLRLQQLLATDYLLTLIEPDQYYPYSWVCWRITGYRQASTEADPASLRGASLAHDLIELCHDLSKASPIPQAALPWPAWQVNELAERLTVSPKTVSRWRQDGLPAWWTTRADGQVRLAIPEPGLRRFVVAHRDAVARCRRFSQLSDAQRDYVLERAQQLQSTGADRLHHICSIIATETGRSVETIRYTLQRHEPQLVQAVAAENPASQACADDHAVIFQCWKSGDSIEAIAQRFERTIRTVRRIILGQRRRHLFGRKITYVYSPEFDLPDAETHILADCEPRHQSVRTATVISDDLPKDEIHVLFSANPGAADPLPPDQEQTTFRQYNYCKFRLSGLLQQLRRKVSCPLLDQAEHWRSRVEALRATLVETNLKLVTAIAHRHLRFGATLEEMASEGNMILMRAIEGFDYTRGFKFSTYASWSITKHFGRLVPLWLARRQRHQTGHEELLKLTPVRDEVDSPLDRQIVGGVVHRLLDKLPRRERKVIQWRYGLLENSPPQSLTQIANKLSISKERVRQIEMRGLKQLRTLLAEEKFQYL